MILFFRLECHFWSIHFQAHFIYRILVINENEKALCLCISQRKLFRKIESGFLGKYVVSDLWIIPVKFWLELDVLEPRWRQGFVCSPTGACYKIHQRQWESGIRLYWLNSNIEVKRGTVSTELTTTEPFQSLMIDRRTVNNQNFVEVWSLIKPQYLSFFTSAIYLLTSQETIYYHTIALEA